MLAITLMPTARIDPLNRFQTLLITELFFSSYLFALEIPARRRARDREEKLTIASIIARPFASRDMQTSGRDSARSRRVS